MQGMGSVPVWGTKTVHVLGQLGPMCHNEKESPYSTIKSLVHSSEDPVEPKIKHMKLMMDPVLQGLTNK